MRSDKRRAKKKNIQKITIVFILIAFILCILIMAVNYVRNKNIKDTIGLIINNNNVTNKLKNELWINEKNVLYMSKNDIQNYLDQYIYLDEKENQIITTYGEKVAVLPLDNNKITINGSSFELVSGVIKKENEYYLPISQMASVYNMEYTYLKDEKILMMDSLERELIKADISKNTKVKKKASLFSSTVGKVEKGEKVVVIKEQDGWIKIRTAKGKIGYVASNKIQNKVALRSNLTKKNTISKVNMVWDYFSEYGKAPNRNDTTIEGINVVSPTFFTLVKKGKGSIKENVGEQGIQYIQWAKKNNYQVWAMLSNNSYKETTSTILNSYYLRETMINQIVTLVNKYQLDGINLDFENMSKSDKDMFSRLIIELKPRLQEAGATLSVDVTALDGGDDWSECYDRNIIGNVADYIVFMGYDQYGSSSPKEGTTAGYNWIETNITKMINREEIKSNKIVLGIPFYTRLWKETNEKITSNVVNMKDITKTLPSNVTKTWDDNLKQYYVQYEQKGSIYKMWIEDEESLKAKLSLVKQYELAGIASWEKDREVENIWAIIKENIN